MPVAAQIVVSAASSLEGRPRDDELDLFGLTHPGLVREANEDHFLLCTVHPQVVLHATSLPESSDLALRGQRLATIMLVADGVGGSAAGSRASRIATEAVTRYVASSLRCYHTADISTEREFEETLRAAAIEAHEAVRSEAASEPDESGMATTLSLAIVVWPWLYVVQVGDSRAYIYTKGRLGQITRDQTMAQALLDMGAIKPEVASRSPLKHVLSSAIGAEDASPVVSRVDVTERGCILIFCTDGLTKHVSDDEIEAMCGRVQSAEQLTRQLLDLALERGGSDNITIIIARAPQKSRATTES